MVGKRSGYDIGAILADMREEYWQGLAGEEEAREELLECVTFTLGGERYAFETTVAAEVIRIPRIVRVPKVQEIITGVFNLRGEILAAMDIRPLLGVSAPPFSSTGRIIVVKGPKFLSGLLVESVKGVEGLPIDAMEPAVKSLPGVAKELIRGQIPVEGELVVLLDMEKLFATPEIMVEQI